MSVCVTTFHAADLYNKTYLVVDPTCAAGLKVLTQAEIDAGKKITMDTSSDPQRVQDMTDLFYAFLLALVVVWGVKQLLNLFTGDTERG